MDKDLQEAAQRALKAGLDPQLVNQRLQQIQQGRQNSSSVLGGDLRSPNLIKNTGVVGNIINSVARPFVQTGQNIGGAAFEVARSALNGRNGADLYAYDPQKGQAAVQNPFISEERFGQIAQNPTKAITDQLKNSAAITSYGVPIGGATKIAGQTLKTGAFTGGALAGGLQSLGNENATAEDVVKGAVTGGMLGKTIDIAGQAFSKLRGGGQALENIGTDLRTGKVNLKASINGAADEKAAQAVLKKYGIKGTPQARYEKIQPVMDSISQEIDAVLGRNTKKISSSQIQEIFSKKIAPYVKQGDLTVQEAKQGLTEYLKNVKQVTPDAFSNTKNLFALKKDLQSGMESLYRKVESGTTLTPAQKSMKALRDTFDEIITKANPEVKQLTLDQSKLYDSVKSISSARKTVGVMRGPLGFTIPKGVVNSATDVGGAALEKAGGAAQSASKLWPGVKMPVSVRGALPRLVNVLQGIQGGAPSPTSTTGQITPQAASTSSIGESGGGAPQITADVVAAAYFVLPRAKADIIKQIYDIQQAGSGAGGKKTEAEQARADVGYLTSQALEKLSTNAIRLGPAAGRIEDIKSIFNAGDPATLEFNKIIASLKATIAKARAGTSFTPNEEKLLEQYTPVEGDSYQQTLTKLQSLNNFFNRKR